ncbi:MAG: SbcC/MukB-like Walker B domain-containing protein [Bacilli bacterium]|nr:SbcC/MukB-like Walker B domain-containing protein [Bacilli bacterium]
MMKTMTKIKLINWHIFDNHTIDINKNTLITGENGHGKSTLLDAVNFILSGASGKFNQAANAYTKRTVESYIRGKTGLEGKTFLRDQDNLISHIALEFYDQLSKKYLTIGVVFELPLSSRRNHGIFYHIADSKLEENYYIRENKILGLNQFKAAVKVNGKEVRTFETKRDIKSMIKSTLGLSSDKYFELLPKALAFHPINEVNKFVYDFLLPEDTVDIESLQTNIYSYREISKLLKIEKEKLDALLPLESLSQTYKKVDSDIKVLDYLKVDLNFDSTQKELEIENDALITNKKDTNKIVNLKSITETKLHEVETSLEELRKSDITIRVSTLEKEIKEEKQKLGNTNNKINSIMELINHETQLGKKIEIEFQGKNFANRESHPELLNSIRDFAEVLDEKKSSATLELAESMNKIAIEKNKKAKIEIEINKLKSNRFTYPEFVELLLGLLKEELKNEFNKPDIDVKPLCELLEIEKDNEIWRNAIEGYLNTQRFDIIVEPQYFNKALEIYEKHKFQRKIHGVGLINTNKLKNYEANPDSLATKVKGLNEFARQSVNMIMGNVICVDEIDQLKNFSKSITPTGMTYRNNTARQINQAIWEKPYIGLKAIQTQLENAIQEDKLISRTINSLIDAQNKLNNLIHIINQSQIRDLFNVHNYFEDKYQAEKTILSQEDELKLLKKDNAWLEVEDLIEKKNNEKEELRLQVNGFIGDLRLFEQKRNDTVERIAGLKHKLEDITNEFKKLPDFSSYSTQIENKKNELHQKYQDSYDKILSAIRTEQTDLTSKLNSNENRLTELMRDYIYKYDNGQLIADIKNLDDFLDVLYRIKGRNIIEYEDKAGVALKACEKSFKEDFLSKLREKIQNAQDGFRILNNALASKPFGSDKEIYKFTYSGSSNPNFRDYYAILQSYEDYESRSLLIESLSEKNLILLKTLFETLTSEDKTEAQVRKIAEYTDYRKYMDYDIKITNKNNDVYYFSKVNREKSGGETQTPFYVIIASSFQQLLDANKRNRSSACVVMFDEAFNNMDESRIEAMMEYYKELNIQLLIAVPPQRLVNIVPYVETTLGLIKTNNTVVVHSWKEQSQENQYEKV